MKLLVVFFLAVLAVVRAQEECGEEKAGACVETLLSSILDDSTEEEVCRELRTSIRCLRDTVDECLGDESDEEVEDGLRELEKVLNENCEEKESQEAVSDGDDEDEEMSKCFEENEDYIYECIYEGTTQALSLVLEQENVDENTLKCSMYSLMSDCFVERVEEKCGSKAAKLAKEELEDLPEEIAEACEAAGEIELNTLQLLDKRRKK